MESSTHRAEAERQRQVEIRRKIKALQAQLTELPEDDDNIMQSPKRKQAEATLLAPSTPSPRKKIRMEQSQSLRGRKSPTVGCTAKVIHSWESNELAKAGSFSSAPPYPAPQPPSNVLKKLCGLSNRPSIQSSGSTYRSSKLSDKSRPSSDSVAERRPEHEAEHEISHSVSRRDDSLAIVEELRMGAIDHKPPHDDPLFERLEPNSGIRLSSRTLSHNDLQEYLRGRYYLSPSRLYSCIRLLPNKSGYDVPVEGDWVTIAVVAERGQVRISRAPVNIESGNDGRASGDEGGEDFYTSHSHTKRQKRESEPARPHGKKYVNIKLIDFGARSRSSATGGKATLRGDAFLSLLLFESDTFDNVKKEDGTVCKIYQGGSRGAYEAMSKLKEGDVIALLNPRVLKPYQRSSNNPHPTNNILAVTPESAGSIAIIGRAQDLGMCKAIKRDGKMCGSWTDKRVSEVCEWHLTNAVQKQRSSRAEFLMGTSGMSTSSIRKRKADYDPSRQWGLKPETESNNSTYIISGHVVGGSAGSLFISEKLGREAQAKAQRRMEKNTDRELKALLDRDKEGMKAVTSARAFAAQVAASSEKVDKGKQKAIDISTDSDANRPCAQDSSVAPKQAYSASTIKQLGFDPAGKVGKRVNDLSLQKKIDALTAVQSSRKNIDLGPRPGPKIRSGVSVPTFMLEKSETVDDWDHVPSGDEAHSDDALIYLDSDT